LLKFSRSEILTEKGSPAVLVYVDTSKQVGDPEHIKVFPPRTPREAWFEENDPEGVVFQYEVLE
jgi:hypothetical protein